MDYFFATLALECVLFSCAAYFHAPTATIADVLATRIGGQS